MEIIFFFSLVLVFYCALADDSKNTALCSTDKDCIKHFGNETKCVEVQISGSIVKKCTPDSLKRKACYGGQFGLCPEYQSPSNNYLNPECIFQNIELTTFNPAKVKICNATEMLSSPDCWIKLQLGKGTNSSGIIGRYQCVDSSECEKTNAFPTSCNNPSCNTGKQSNCNNRGTCTQASFTRPDIRGCMCYAGFSGPKCEKTLSNACDIGCGDWGACIKRKCKCDVNWSGDSRCSKCSNNKACENGGICDLPSGKCKCADGYHGPSCSATSNKCVGIVCGPKGRCQDGVCLCQFCNPNCKKCASKACTECSYAKNTQLASMIVILFGFLAILLTGA